MLEQDKITVVKSFTFDSAHYLPNYDGPCANMHGHTYKLEIGICGFVDEKTGMVIDFSIVKQTVDKLLKKIDHTLLNEVQLDEFPQQNPTAENMVFFFKKEMKKQLNNIHRELTFVRLWETPTSYAEWRE